MIADAPTEVAYLTVQDVLWINLQVTKTVNSFEYSKLEEAVYHQYGYGGSTDVPVQAERFLNAMLSLSPLAKGNAATAFVGYVVFLALNNYGTHFDDSNAVSLLDNLSATGKKSDSTAVDASKRPTHGHANVREFVEHVLAAYPTSIKSLASRP